jgi:hypothetical protein
MRRRFGSKGTFENSPAFQGLKSRASGLSMGIYAMLPWVLPPRVQQCHFLLMDQGPVKGQRRFIGQMSNEEKQVQAKLEELRQIMRHNEARMRETFIKYEELAAQRQSLASSIGALREFRNKRRRNVFADGQ